MVLDIGQVTGAPSNMELTIEQALQQAVDAHKAGKLQNAERLYRAILQAQPKHPDANHNLGVLAVSMNKAEYALPFFSTALEANPSQGQFWLSYIDALIKVEQFDNAKEELSRGTSLGLEGEMVDSLKAQLAAILLGKATESSSINRKLTFTQQRKKVAVKKDKKKSSPSNYANLNLRSPPQGEVNTLIEHYQKRRYDQAEFSAKNLAQKYPNHPFSWKVLGTLFQQTGRLQESVIANQKVLAISPSDAEAHNNLGLTLFGLGRLEESEASYKKAISIKPNVVEAHYNLGNTLQKLGRTEEAEASYIKAIEIKPDLAEAHSNLGAMLQEIGRLEEAETSYKKAIAIKPEYAEKLSHAIASLTGLNPVRASDAYVSSLFDGYAKKFESNLVGELNYKTPTTIANFLRPLISLVNLHFDILDLGCGTGLAGEALIDVAKTLVGIDLSKEMLKISEKKNIYDRLVQDEIHHALSQERGASFDIIVSSDVFIYLGDLKAIFNQAYDVLKVGGFFAFSTEALFAINSGKEEYIPDYKLNPTGRYSHSSKYLLELIDAKRFILHILELVQIRLEKGQPAMGYVVIIQKKT